jgi:hypothetical protein
MHDATNELPLEKWELYDLDADRTELNNLAEEHPGIVKELSAEWQRWAERIGAVPKPPKQTSMPKQVKERLEAGETAL